MAIEASGQTVVQQAGDNRGKTDPVSDIVEPKREMAAFSLHETPLLKSGSSMALVARTPSLWAHVKVYAEGGENALHAHPKEDHLFFVLQGRATFHDADGAEIVVGANQGITVPRGVLYSFQACGDENLVLLRVGTAIAPAYEAPSDRYPEVPIAAVIRENAEGLPFAGDDAGNKTGAMAGVPSGDVFGDAAGRRNTK